MKISSARKIAVSVSAIALTVLATGVEANTATGKYLSSKQLKVVEQVAPDYPRFADIAGVDGYVVLEFTVSADGSVAEPTVSESSSTLFTRAALTAIEGWQFEPVVDNGVAVPVRTNVKFSFVPRTE